ncbi:MAG: type IV pilus modification protein PilV [Pseudomonadota bacterium]
MKRSTIPRHARGVQSDRAPGAPGQQGFSLIEVLVALLVMSVGLLTVAALQVFSLQVEAQALNGTRATLLAADIVDRIRANPAGAATYQLGLGVGAPPTEVVCADTQDVDVTAPCTPQILAAYDLWAWRQAMTAGNPLSIPSGDGSIEYLPGTPNAHRITVQWLEENETKTYTITVGQ